MSDEPVSLTVEILREIRDEGRRTNERLDALRSELGERIDAETAREFGLVNRIFPTDGFRKRAQEFAGLLAENSASALALSKALLYQIDGTSFEAAIRAGADVNALARLTPDCQEGIRRFLDR